MKDRLEEFVRSHQEEFDVFEPSEELWGKIQHVLKPRQQIRWTYYLSRVAVVAVIIGGTLIAQRMFTEQREKPAKPRVAEVEIDIPELREAEVYYTGMLNEKLEEVKPYLAGNPDLQDELEMDLSELDSIYVSLKNDLKDDIANQEVLEAMIQNYRLRISLLEDMLEYLAPEEDELNSNTGLYDL
ncbi:MAG: hypothetical protein JW801_04850 [Bacteroidales bacterium]|nr:hypothetical protein [Bacteroidales bacterium]